jgi:hypothetical protein
MDMYFNSIFVFKFKSKQVINEYSPSVAVIFLRATSGSCTTQYVVQYSTCCICNPASLIDSRWKGFEGLLPHAAPLPRPPTHTHEIMYRKIHERSLPFSSTCNYLNCPCSVDRRFLKYLELNTVIAKFSNGRR